MTWSRRLDDTAVVLVLAGLALTWVGRAGVTVGLPTTVVSYADFLLVPLALLVSLGGSGRRLRPRWLACGLVGLGLVGLVSGLVNGVPLTQVGVGVMLYAEPFTVVYVLWGSSTPWLRTAALRVVIGVLALQLPFALGQWITEGAGDPVQGTLVGSGAGAHVLGSGALLGAALLLASRWRFRPWSIALVALAVGVMVVADAKQVWALLPVVVVVLFLKHNLAGRQHHRHRRPSRLRIVVGVVVLSALVVPVGFLVANSYVGNIIALTAENRGGKLAVAEKLGSDVTDSAGTTAVGLGPGETVSRLAWMLSPQGGIDDSPLTSLGMEPSAQALTYHEAATSMGYVGESSVSYPLSSVLGVFGDYGVAGSVAYVVLWVGLVRALWRTRESLASAALAVWGSLLALGLISDWLEQTPITLMVAVVSGVALASARTEPAAEVPQHDHVMEKAAG